MIQNLSLQKFIVTIMSPSREKAFRQTFSQWYSIMGVKDCSSLEQLVMHSKIFAIVCETTTIANNDYKICHRIKSNAQLRCLPLILLGKDGSQVSVEQKIQGLKNGADVYLDGDITTELLHLQIENLTTLKFVQKNTQKPHSPYFCGENLKFSSFLNSINDILEKQLEDIDFSVSMLAELMHMSIPNFYKVFKSITQTTPNCYIMKFRMNKAAEYLKSGEHINEVMLKVGFTSSSYFAKCFKNLFMMSPKDYIAYEQSARNYHNNSIITQESRNTTNIYPASHVVKLSY